MTDRINQLRAKIEAKNKIIRKLRKKMAAARGKNEAATPAVSPLAPKGGFPELPAIRGLELAAGAAGVKYKDRDDVMLAKLDAGSAIAGVFTKSATRSAPVLDCQRKIAEWGGSLSQMPVGLVVNSGNSNAFTGRAGDASVERVCNGAAEALGTGESHILTASTGVIGEPLPDERISAILNGLANDLAGGNSAAAAKAIMTTDTFPKGSGRTIEINGKSVNIAGFAKGSGMIAPDMATMLVFIFTDAAVRPSYLQNLLGKLCNQTFNAITVDSDTSTSDSLILAATGQAGNREIRSDSSAAGKEFAEALEAVMLDLAQQVVRDGEGATKFVEILVSGAASETSARKIGLAIANSPLVKTAIAGEDPNWGRIVMAIGKSGEPADRDLIRISLGDILVAEKGWVSPDYQEEAGAAYMKQQDLKIHVDLGVGDGSATIWTCDLTHQYISINADYRS